MGLTSTKLGSMCLAPGHNAVTLVRLEPAAPQSRVKHSTTEPLRSLHFLKSIAHGQVIKVSQWHVMMC